MGFFQSMRLHLVGIFGFHFDDYVFLQMVLRSMFVIYVRRENSDINSAVFKTTRQRDICMYAKTETLFSIDRR